jgi:hypothetical protein
MQQAFRPTCKNGVFLVFLGHAAAPSGLKLGKLSSRGILSPSVASSGGKLVKRLLLDPMPRLA